MKVQAVKARPPRRFAPIDPTSAAASNKAIAAPTAKPSFASSALAPLGLTLVPLLLILVFNAGLPSSSSRSRRSSHQHPRGAPLSRHSRHLDRHAPPSARYDLARLLNVRHFASAAAATDASAHPNHHAAFVPRRSLVARYHRLARAYRCPAMSTRSPTQVSVLRSALARVPVSAPRLLRAP